MVGSTQIKKIKSTRKRWRWVSYFGKVFRIITLPIFFWYRLYLWVWDGTMFED